MPDPKQVLSDPDFKALPMKDRRSIIDSLLEKDADFKGLQGAERQKLKGDLYGKYGSERKVAKPKGVTGSASGGIGALPAPSIQQQARSEIQKQTDQAETARRTRRSENAAAGRRVNEAARKLGSLDIPGALKSVRPGDFNPLGGLQDIAQPIEQGLSHLAGNLRQAGGNYQQQTSPLQKEIDTQTNKLPLGQQVASQPGVFAQMNPQFSRYLDQPSQGIPETAGKALGRGARSLLTVDNAAIASVLGPAHAAGAVGKVVHMAATGYFGVEAAHGIDEGLKKYKASGGKDKDALADAIVNSVFLHMVSEHGMSEALKIRDEAMRSKNPAQSMAQQALPGVFDRRQKAAQAADRNARAKDLLAQRAAARAKPPAAQPAPTPTPKPAAPAPKTALQSALGKIAAKDPLVAKKQAPTKAAQPIPAPKVDNVPPKPVAPPEPKPVEKAAPVEAKAEPPKQEMSSDHWQSQVDQIEDQIEKAGGDPLKAANYTGRAWEPADPNNKAHKALAEAYAERDRAYEREDAAALKTVKLSPATLKGPIEESHLQDVLKRIQKRTQYGTAGGQWQAKEVARLLLSELKSKAYESGKVDSRLIDEEKDWIDAPNGRAVIEQARSMMKDLGLTPPESMKEIAAAPKQIEAEVAPKQFTDWIDKQPKGRVYTKASALYEAYKAEHPGTTREQFGQMMQHVAASGGHEIVTPSANLKSGDVFTFKDSTGIERRVAGVRPKAAVAEDEPDWNWKPHVPEENKPLGTYLHPHERPLGMWPTEKIDAYAKKLDVSKPEDKAKMQELVRELTQREVEAPYLEKLGAVGKVGLPIFDNKSDVALSTRISKAIEAKPEAKTKPAVPPPSKPPTKKVVPNSDAERTQLEYNLAAAVKERNALGLDRSGKRRVGAMMPDSRITAPIDRRIRELRAKLAETTKAEVDKPPTKKVAAPAPAAPKGPVKLSAAEANTLGMMHDKGNVFGDKLSAATKPVSLTAEEAAAMRRLTESQKIVQKSALPSLYPESAPPKRGVKSTIAGPKRKSSATGAVNLGPLINAVSNIAPAAKAIGKRAAGSQAVTSGSDFAYGKKAAHTAESPEVLDATNKHENSRASSKLKEDKYVPAVTAHLTPDDAAKFLPYLNADRMLKRKLYLQGEIARGNAQKAALKSNIKTLANARDAAVLTHDPAAIKRAQYDLDEALRQEAANRRQIAHARMAHDVVALERGANPHGVDLPGGIRHDIKASDIGPFLARPEIKEAIRKHLKVEALLNKYQRMQGNQAGVSVGHHTGRYAPAVAVNADGSIKTGGGSKGGALRPKAALDVNPYAKGFEGDALKYEQDYNKAMRHALSSSLSRATEREMHLQRLKHGMAIEYDMNNPDLRRVKTDHNPNQLQMKYKGKWENANMFSVQNIDPRIPATMAMPSRFYAEVQPLHEEFVSTVADEVANTAFGKIVKMTLSAPADIAMHRAALGSWGAHAAARAINPADHWAVTSVKQAIKGLALPYQSTINDIRFNNPNLYPDDMRYRALTYATEAGVWNEKYGDVGNKPLATKTITTASGTRTVTSGGAPKNLLSRENFTLDRAKHLGHNVLYGDRGALSNALTATYKAFKDNGALNSPEGKLMLKQAMRDSFNSVLATDQSKLAKVARSVTLGTYMNTGVTNRTAALKAGPMLYAAGAASRNLFIIAAVGAATGGRKPWDIPGYKWGYIPIGRDKKGHLIFIDGAIFDRAGMYPDRMLHTVLQSMYDTKKGRVSARQGALEAATDLGSQIAAPIFSGPTVSVGSTVTGLIPRVYPSDTLSGIKVGNSPAAKLGFTKKRAIAVGVSLLPIFAVATDPGKDMTSTAVTDDDYKMLNIFMRMAGLTQMSEGVDESVVEKRRADAEKAAARTDAKAMGTYTPARRGGVNLYR